MEQRHTASVFVALLIVTGLSAGCDKLPFMGSPPLAVKLQTTVQDTTGEYETFDADDDGTNEETLWCGFSNGFLELEVTGGPDKSFIRLENASRTMYESPMKDPNQVIGEHEWTQDDLVNFWQTVEMTSGATWPSDAWGWWAWGGQNVLDGFYVEVQFEATKCPGGTCSGGETVALSAEVECHAPSGSASLQPEMSAADASADVGGAGGVLRP